MNVTPEIEVPIIEMETTYQGDFRSPRKNSVLLAPRRAVSQLTRKTKQK